MKFLTAFLLLAAVGSLHAQMEISPYRALRPIMKDPNHPNAPTSLNQTPRDMVEPPPLQPARPVEIVARIEAGLAASQISLLGTVNGLKGRLYVTNLTAQPVTPLIQLAVCDQKGFQVGSASKIGPALSPGDSERMEVLATNLNAVDLKLVKLSRSQSK